MIAEQETLNRLFDEVLLSPAEIYQHKKLQLVQKLFTCNSHIVSCYRSI